MTPWIDPECNLILTIFAIQCNSTENLNQTSFGEKGVEISSVESYYLDLAQLVVQSLNRLCHEMD